MIAYAEFCGDMQWHPRQVDELTLGEFFWLPVIRQAKTLAAARLMAAREK